MNLPASVVACGRTSWSGQPATCTRLAAAAAAGAIGVPRADPEHQGMHEDLQVEADRPPRGVVGVVLDALLDRRVAAPAVDLRPAGDAGLDLVAQHVARHAAPEVLHEARPL